MKKTIILFMLLMSIPVMAQVRLGFSIDSIMKEYSSREYQGMKDTLNSGNTFYAITTSFAKIYYYFDEYKNCYMVQIIPINSEYLNSYTQRYNTNYTVLSLKSWRAYLPQIIADIRLEYPDLKDPKSADSQPYFLWSFAE